MFGRNSHDHLDVLRAREVLHQGERFSRRRPDRRDFMTDDQRSTTSKHLA